LSLVDGWIDLYTNTIVTASNLAKVIVVDQRAEPSQGQGLSYLITRLIYILQWFTLD